jgi:hypothetical protein
LEILNEVADGILLPSDARREAEDLLVEMVGDPEIESAWHDASSMWEG